MQTSPPPILSEAEVRSAAAYRVIFERMNPQDCITPEARMRMAEIVRDVMQWAQTQPDDVRAAYQTASAQISKMADEYLENNTRARRMLAAYDTLPKPPC